MLTVLELGASELPKEFLAVLPTHCDSCGSENEITESLTMLRCSNAQCGEKSVQRMVAMLKDLGVKNMGESKCRSFLEHFETNNPYAIFSYESDVDGPLYAGCSQEFSEAMHEQLNKNRKMLLWEFVKIGNLPGIRDSARKLLAKYDDLEEFYDDLEGGGIAFIQDLLSIKGKEGDLSDTSSSFDDDDSNDSVSVKATATYSTLVAFKEELLESVQAVEIMTLDTGVINLCISTSVGKPYGSKKDFISQMNEEFGDKVHLNFLESVSKDCEFLIWSKIGAATSKVDKIGRINEKRRAENIKNDLDPDEGMIPIMTGSEFKEYLETL
jgi:NAD-dependent DNA ligase